MYDMRWTPLSKHLADPDFPTTVCVGRRATPTPPSAVRRSSQGRFVEAVAGATPRSIERRHARDNGGHPGWGGGLLGRWVWTGRHPRSRSTAL
jgi:hypothetical protein